MSLQAAISQLNSLAQERLPESDTDSDRPLEAWRDRIDVLDRVVAQLLNERCVCARHIGRIKKAHQIPVYDPMREGAVLNNVTNSNPGPLSDEATKRIFERVIDETRSLERHLFRPDADRPGVDSTLETD